MGNSTSAGTAKPTTSWAVNISPFLIPTVLLLLLLGSALLFIPKGELHLWLCDHHTPAFDAFLPFYSDMVNWLPYTVVVLLLLYRAGWAVFVAGDILLTTLIVQPVKHLVHAPRPLTWFAENMPDVSLPLTEGVRMNYWLSFPSGHTTTFFMLFFALSLIAMTDNLRGKYVLSLFCFLFAAVGAYSRIYLCQHFALDVFAGIIIAVLCTLLLYFIYVPRVKSTRFWDWRIRFPKK